MPLNSVVQTFRTGTYVVTRYGPETYVGGVLVPDPAPVTFPIVASVLPVTTKFSNYGLEVQARAEGEHARHTRAIYTVTELKTRDGDGAGDMIVIDGDVFRVTDVKFWQGFQEDGSANLYEAYVSRQNIP